MATLSMKHFDVLDFVKKSKELGASQEMAEFQARQIEVLADTLQEQNQEIEALKKLEPVTKRDLEIVKLELQKEIEELRKEIQVVKLELQKEIAMVKNELVKWVLGTGIATILAIAGLLKFMLH